MDYTEAFKNLRTNNKYGRKSPHKAILMLTVIKLYEQNILTDNEIFYDKKLKSMFLKVWNRVLPKEPLFHPDAYLPFWYLQNDSFWHIVPNRGKEDILALMRDTNIKPSEAKLEDSVRYAELDEDLYFLMTLPSGRSSLKRALLETYFNLTEGQIDHMSESEDNYIDYSISALSEYEKILSKGKNETKSNVANVDEEILIQFNELSEDLQISLNYEYFSFLKKYPGEREMFKEICPTVYDLYHNIVNHPLSKNDIAPSFVFTYENFLSDLKIDLMSEDGAMDLIDRIGEAIDLLRGNANIVNHEVIEPSECDIEESSSDNKDKSPSQDYIFENKANRCYIIDNQGERVFTSEGQIVKFDDVFYRINYSDSIVTMVIIQEDSDGVFSLGRRILSAHYRSPLYTSLDKKNYLQQFKAVRYDADCDEYYVQVDNRWYGNSGYYADLNSNNQISSIEPFSEPQKSSSEDKAPLNSMEVEHVFLDSRGKIVKKVTSSQLEYSPENDNIKESRKGKTWTEEEENLLTRYFQLGIDTSVIAEKFGRTEVAIKSRLAKLGLIEYSYGQDDITSHTNSNDIQESYEEKDYTIENSFTRCSILDKNGKKVFTANGKLKYLSGKLYRFNLKNECFTIKNMVFDGSIWSRGEKKIVAYPQSELYRMMDYAVDYIDEVEDIIDNPIFENCKLKVKGVWYNYNGSLGTDTSGGNEDGALNKNSDKLSVIKSPLYAVRKQAILRAMGFFRLPAKIKDITRTISRTAWGSVIKEDDVEEIINTISNVESVEGKYFLKEKGGMNDNQKNIKTTSSPEKMTLTPSKKSKANYGNWIKWNPTGVTGKVIGFKNSGSLQKIVIRTKDGNEVEVYDNPKLFEIIL